MADLRLVAFQTRFQLISLARSRRALVLGVLFPVVLLLMFNSVFVPGDDTVDVGGATIAAHAYFTAAMLAYAILGSAFNQVAIGLVSQRESGQLKRLRGTPVPAWTFVVAPVLRVLVTVGLVSVVLLAIGRFAYHVPMAAGALGEILLYLVLGAAALCSAGIAATTVVPDVDSASAALPFAAVLLAFISGIFVTVDRLPGWLEEVGRLFPVTTSPPACRRRWASPATRRSGAATSSRSRCGRPWGSSRLRGGSGGSRPGPSSVACVPPGEQREVRAAGRRRERPVRRPSGHGC